MTPPPAPRAGRKLVASLAVAVLLSGCFPNRHLRKDDSWDRQAAMASYGTAAILTIPVLAGFAAGLGGNEKALKWAFPLFWATWALGIGGVSYLGIDDALRGESFLKSKEANR